MIGINLLHMIIPPIIITIITADKTVRRISYLLDRDIILLEADGSINIELTFID